MSDLNNIFLNLLKDKNEEKVIEFLNKNPEFKMYKTNDNWTLSHYSLFNGFNKLLLYIKDEVNFNLKYKSSTTPLYWGILKSNFLSSFLYIVLNNYKLDYLDSNFKSPLDKISEIDKEIFDLLIEFSMIRKNIKLNSYISETVLTKSYEKFDLNKKDGKYKSTLLMDLIFKDEITKIEQLLKLDHLDINEKDKNGKTALYKAIFHKKYKIIDLILSYKINEIDFDIKFWSNSFKKHDYIDLTLNISNFKTNYIDKIKNSIDNKNKISNEKKISLIDSQIIETLNNPNKETIIENLDNLISKLEEMTIGLKSNQKESKKIPF